MKKRKYRGSIVLKRLIEYLMLSLDELTTSHNISQFTEGQIIAFVECLEFVSNWTSYHKYGIENIEQHFPIG